MCNAAEEAQWHCVIDDVGHDHVIAFVFEEMLVMPEGVGAEALFIDKEMQVFAMRDLGGPSKRHERRRLDAVVDNHTCVHLLATHIGEDAELHVIGGDFVEVFRTGEKIPGFIDCRVEDSLSFECVDLHLLAV